MRVTDTKEPFEIEDGKRFYVPGTKLIGACPNCNADFEHNFATQYLSYPVANKPFEHMCYCQKCDHEWTVKLQLRVALEAL